MVPILKLEFHWNSFSKWYSFNSWICVLRYTRRRLSFVPSLHLPDLKSRYLVQWLTKSEQILAVSLSITSKENCNFAFYWNSVSYATPISHDNQTLSSQTDPSFIAYNFYDYETFSVLVLALDSNNSTCSFTIESTLLTINSFSFQNSQQENLTVVSNYNYLAVIHDIPLTIYDPIQLEIISDQNLHEIVIRSSNRIEPFRTVFNNQTISKFFSSIASSKTSVVFVSIATKDPSSSVLLSLDYQPIQTVQLNESVTGQLELNQWSYFNATIPVTQISNVFVRLFSDNNCANVFGLFDKLTYSDNLLSNEPPTFITILDDAQLNGFSLNSQYIGSTVTFHLGIVGTSSNPCVYNVTFFISKMNYLVFCINIEKVLFLWYKIISVIQFQSNKMNFFM